MKKKRALKTWIPKRFPRMKHDRKVLQIGSEILRATWNQIYKNKTGWEQDVYKILESNSYEKKAKHYFPIISNICLQEGIGFAVYLKVLCEYGIYGLKRIMPNIVWLASPKALTTFDWLYEKMRKENPNFEDWKWARDNPNDEQFDSRPSSIQIKEEIKHSIKHLQKLLIIHENKIDIGSMTIFELEHLSPWYLAICEKFVEMDGMSFADKKLSKQIKQAQRYYEKHPEVKHKSRKLLTAFYNRNDGK